MCSCPRTKCSLTSTTQKPYSGSTGTSSTETGQQGRAAMAVTSTIRTCRSQRWGWLRIEEVEVQCERYAAGVREESDVTDGKWGEGTGISSGEKVNVGEGQERQVSDEVEICVWKSNNCFCYRKCSRTAPSTCTSTSLKVDSTQTLNARGSTADWQQFIQHEVSMRGGKHTSNKSCSNSSI